MKKSGPNLRLGLPTTGHTKSAVDNPRRKRDLPEAIEQLVVQGLSSNVAVTLVTKVVNDFGLRGIAKQSEVFHWLARDSATRAETRMLFDTGKTVKQFKTAYDLEISKAFDMRAMQRRSWYILLIIRMLPPKHAASRRPVLAVNHAQACLHQKLF